MLAKTTVCMALIWAGILWGEAPLAARRQGHTLVLSGVFINDMGPLVMMVDTGATSTSVKPAVAARLGLVGQYRVEQVTAAGSGLVVAARGKVRVGAVEEGAVEILIAEAGWTDVDGVLGQSFLERRDYELDYERERIEFDAPMPVRGIRIPLELAEGRPAVRVKVDGESLPLVLDSGASTLLLFRSERRFAGRARVDTNGGALEAGLGEATLELGGRLRKRVPAVELAVARVNGLMPACLFKQVFVARRAGVVVIR